MLTRTIIPTLVALALVCGAAPAAAEYRNERALALAPGGTFLLDADAGAVTITGDSTDGAFVSITSRDDDFDRRYDVEFEERPGAVTVRVKRRAGWLADWFRSSWRHDTRITIRVPRATSATVSTAGGSIEAARLGHLRLRTSGGSVNAADVNGAAELRTSGGAIVVRRVRGDLDASTSGGDIRAGEVLGAVRADTSGGRIDIDGASGDVYASTSGGGVRVAGAGGSVEAHTSGGSVSVGFAAGNARGGDLSTSGGGVTAVVDPTVALTIDATSSGGGVNADVPVTIRGPVSRRSLMGDMNGGGALLRLRSSGGSVRIAAIPAFAARR
jgi:hypothetical protein